jgi:hypothetical protein
MPGRWAIAAGAAVLAAAVSGTVTVPVHAGTLPKPIPCGQDETSWGYVAAVRPGERAAAERALGKQLFGQIEDNATGQLLDIIGRPDSTKDFRGLFTAWGPAYPQAKQPALLSCNYLLADKPADKPLINAAIAAVVKAGYRPSAAWVRSNLQIVTVSDNPLTPLRAGDVIVTLMFTGPGRKLPNGPVVHSLVSDTVLEVWPGAHVTGVAKGGFD